MTTNHVNSGFDLLTTTLVRPYTVKLNNVFA